MDGVDPSLEPATDSIRGQPAEYRAPLVAIVLASACILVLAFRHPIDGVSDLFDERFVYALAMVAPSLLIAELAVFFIVARTARPRWKIATLGGLAVAAILIALLRAGFPAVGAEPQKISVPAARFVEVLISDLAGERLAFERQIKAAGFSEIATGKGLSRSSPTLTHCDRFEKLTGDAMSVGGRVWDHIFHAEAVAGLGDPKPEQLRACEEPLFNSYDKEWYAIAGMMETTGQMCRLLADHRWENRDGQILFYRAEDRDRFNRISARVQRLDEEQRRLGAKLGADLRRFAES